MKEIKRKDIREDLINAIMKIEDWTAELRFIVIEEIFPRV